MAIKDLFKPKWKHSDPAIRLEALEDAGDNQTLIARYARNDTDPSVRIAAVGKMTDIEILSQIASEDTDPEVQQAAGNAINKYAGKQFTSDFSPEIRQTVVDTINDEKTLASLACKEDDPEIRTTLVYKISTPSLLIKVASSNCGIAAGHLIVDKIDSPDDLAILAQKASNKKIRKMAADKKARLSSDQPADSAEDMKAAESLLKKLEESMKLFIPEEADRLMIVADEQWEALSNSVREKYQQRFTEVKTSLHEKRATILHTRVITELESLCKQVETLVDKAGTDTATELNPNAVSQLQADFETRLFSPELSHEEKQALTERFCKAREVFKTTLASASEKQARLEEENRQTIKTLTDLCEQAEKVAENDSDTQVLSTQKNDLCRLWKDNFRPVNKSEELKDRFNKAIDRIDQAMDTHIKAQQKETEIKLDQLRTIRADIEALTSTSSGDDLFRIVSDVRGHINEFKALISQIRDKDLTDGIEEPFNELCNDFFSRFDAHRENREWERWANLNRKNEMCELARRIADKIDDGSTRYEDVQQIRGLQAEWKETGPVAKDKKDEINQAFRETCDKVYDHYITVKTSLLEKVRQAAGMDMYNEAAKQIKQIQHDWNQIGPLPLALESGIRTEFKEICDAFFEKRRLFFQERDLERQENFNVKSDLCDQAEQHTGSTDWKNATALYRDLQQQWKNTGPVPKDEDENLWQRFSSACDAFFQRYNTYKIDNLTLKTNLCDQTEAIYKSLTEGGQSNDASIDTLCNQVKDIQRQWKEIGPVPNEDADLLWTSFRGHCDAIFDLRDKRHQNTLEEKSDIIDKKEDLVQRAEAIKDSENWQETADTLKSLQEEWKNTPDTVPPVDHALKKRLQEACDVFFQNRRTAFEKSDKEKDANLKTKQDLCFTLEIMAKAVLEKDDIAIDDAINPAEQVRLAMDIRDRVIVPGNHRETWNNIMKKVKEIKDQWNATGRAPSASEKDLRNRFYTTLDLFHDHKGGD